MSRNINLNRASENLYAVLDGKDCVQRVFPTELTAKRWATKRGLKRIGKFISRTHVQIIATKEPSFNYFLGQHLRAGMQWQPCKSKSRLVTFFRGQKTVEEFF